MGCPAGQASAASWNSRSASATCRPSELATGAEPVLDDIATKHRQWLAEGARDDDPRRRTPGAALRRLLQARDQRCFFMGCRAPATAAQIDHTVRWAESGPTLESNLGAGCTHDHRLKDEGGWTLTATATRRALVIA